MADQDHEQKADEAAVVDVPEGAPIDVVSNEVQAQQKKEDGQSPPPNGQ